tara:strand:+ start:11652 stop:13709 length:2058 start_codon:yes stop_codon:yes gene_type:complete
MGGKSERFGGAFKPFLKMGDLSFIELAYEPFKKWEEYISTVTLICTAEQEAAHNVSENLKRMFLSSKVRFDLRIIGAQTDGPLQTLRSALDGKNAGYGNIIVCDCDHSIKVDPIFAAVLSGKGELDCVIPTWKIKEEEHHNWSKILVKDDKLVDFYEKERLACGPGEYVRGIIGCIYFSKVKYINDSAFEYRHISQLIRDLSTSGKKIGFVNINHAYFYGDPTMAQRCIEQRRSECTIFCDIDGVLFSHRDHSNCNEDENIRLQGYQHLQRLKNQGHRIILTTARSEKYREGLKTLLYKKGIGYDKIVMGLASGPRILINDRKPSMPFTKQATSFEVIRNSGLRDFDVQEIVKSNNIKILKDLSANSFAKTLLIERGCELIVRKSVIKTEKSKKHYETLKRQCDDLRRLFFIAEGSVPLVLDEVDNELEYYYDMEWLSEHIVAAELEDHDKITCLNNVVSLLSEKIYSLSKDVDGDLWIKQFLNEKIYPKFDTFVEFGEEFDRLINSDKVTINGKKYWGLRKIFEKLNYKDIKPEKIGIVHGDLTLENIMYNLSDGDIKLIDMDGSRLFDARELDLGKLSQSIILDYANWKNSGDLNCNYENEVFECTDQFFEANKDGTYDLLIELWKNILKNREKVVYNKAIFYMCTYLIRFVPFRVQIGKDHGIFALLMAVVWLNKLIQRRKK